ncbi:MAG: cation diffusion facilitator family transporter [Chthonomonadales bacterium]
MAHLHGGDWASAGRRMRMAMGLTVAFVAAEALAGWRSGSLALLSDAGHNLADALSLGLSAFAVWISQKPATAGRTYGYHRAGILVAAVNAMSLVAVALAVGVEAVQRLRHPAHVEASWMVGVALIAFILNSLIGLWLHAPAREDLNTRSAYLHMVGDAFSSAGVAIAGAFVWLTGRSAADAVVSMVIAFLILWSAGAILVEALNILLEAAPEGIDASQLERAVHSVPGVLSVHDVHVWTISSGIIAASCHVVVADQSVRSAQEIAEQAAAEWERVFGITHATIQVEVERCEPAELVCTLRRNGGSAQSAGAMTEEP